MQPNGQAQRWMLAIFLLGSASAWSGENSDLIYTYEVVPANPAPNTPFALRLTYDDGALVIDSNATHVSIDGNEINVTVGFLLGYCPPIILCPPHPEANLPIPGLPTGLYRMHIVDDDGSPPFDASINFAIGNPPAVAAPTLSLMTKGILLFMFSIAGCVAFKRLT